MQCLGASFAYELQVRFPHIGADEADLGDDVVAHGGEESLERFNSSFSAHPEQAGDADIDLVDQRQVLMASGVLDFIDANGVDLTERAVLQPPGDDMLDRQKLCPRKCESTRRFLSTKGGAPNGLGRAYRPWSGCVCRRPREPLRQPQRRKGDSRLAALHTAGKRRIPTEE